MRKPRTNLLLLTTIFVIVGLVGQAWLASGSIRPSLGLATETVGSAGTPAKETLVGLAENSVSPAGTEGPAVSLSSLPPEQLSDDASVLVTEMCNLQLMASGTDLALRSNQWMEFAAVVLRSQAIRHTYEAQIAHWKVISPGRYRVEIPAYAKAGDELRGQFSHDLNATLGELTAREVMAKLGSRLEGCFAGFGVSVQTLDVTDGPAGQPNDIQVTRTVSYWNSHEGGDRLTTRQEVHFPVLEDPTGDSWIALLAAVGTTGSENGPG